MRIELNDHACVIMRGESPKAYKETTLLYHIKQALQGMGHDVIKKRMWKDGHLVDDSQGYIRTRNTDPRKGPAWCLHFDAYALRFLFEDYNTGELILTRHTL